MLFFVYNQDRPGAGEVRAATRAAHLAYMKEFPALAAGPTLNEAGEMDGSVILLDLPDEATARAFVENDPYAKAGLFAQSVVKRWKKVVPADAG